jgi:hypothetical protein
MSGERHLLLVSSEHDGSTSAVFEPVTARLASADS